MATHSSLLAWKIPQTEEPGGLQSMGSQSRTLLSTHAQCNARYKNKVGISHILNSKVCVYRVDNIGKDYLY